MPLALYFLASCLRPVLEERKQRKKNCLILIDLLGFVKNLRILKQYYHVCYSREGMKITLTEKWQIVETVSSIDAQRSLGH